MPDEYFVVDRRAYMKPGLELQLAPWGSVADSVAETLSEMFPEGLSPHGHTYWLRGVIHDGASYNGALELVFEWVRRAQFPMQPSRMTSWFGSETLEEARQFRDAYGPHSPIFKVNAEGRTAKVDMSCLNPTASLMEVTRRAVTYWSGRANDVAPVGPTVWEHLLEPPLTVIEAVE